MQLVHDSPWPSEGLDMPWGGLWYSQSTSLANWVGTKAWGWKVIINSGVHVQHHIKTKQESKKVQNHCWQQINRWSSSAAKSPEDGFSLCYCDK